MCNFDAGGLFTRFDIETDTDTDERFACVEVFTLHRDRYQHKVPIGSLPILLVLVSVSVSVGENSVLHR